MPNLPQNFAPDTATCDNRRFEGLIGLAILCAALFAASGVMKTVWAGHDLDWMGLRLISAGPKNDGLHDLAVYLQAISLGLLGAAAALFLALATLRHALMRIAKLGARRPRRSKEKM